MASRKSNFQAKKDNVGAKPHQGSAQNTGDIGALIGKLDAASRPAAAPRRKATGTELRVGILLWPQFPLLSLAGLCDGLRHAADVGHPIVRSAERGEDWSWCFLDEVGFVVTGE